MTLCTRWNGGFHQPADGGKSSALLAVRLPEDFLQFARDVLGITQRDDEVLSFLDVARALEPRRVCEIGTSSGATICS